MDKMPFLYNVYKDYDHREYHYSIVKIAIWSLVHAKTNWMNDDELPSDFTLSPDVSLEVESHRFNSEQEAVEFIKNWWKKQ